MPETTISRRLDRGPLGTARMSGSSIAAPDAAGWITDFLNAAYYRRPAGERAVDELRLANCILTTYWARKAAGRRLHLVDLPAFHRAFGSTRFRGERSPRGVLGRQELLEGAATLLGPWFPEAWADPARRGWGIAFSTARERAAHDPGRRLALARLGALTPEQAPLEEQVWHTYPPVEVPSAGGVVAALTAPETWPDFASAIGRFTPLRPGGLLGQTFEIEVAAGTSAGLPVFTRGYVTVTALVTPADPAALRQWTDAVQDGLARYGEDEPPALPDGAEAVAGLDLTTHEGHFLGSGHNRLLLFEHDGRAWVRAIGTWDPLPWHLEGAYRVAGRDAQHAFWGQGEDVERSMLHQLALHVAESGG